MEIDKTMSLWAANMIAGLLVIPVVLLFFIPYILLHGAVTIDITTLWVMTALLVVTVSIVIHEGLHGIGYKLAGATWKEIEYGVKSFSPYAHCKVPLEVNGYRVAVALPGFILGIIPGFIGVALGSAELTLFGALMAASALGDVMILWLLRDAPSHARVLDHPTKVGCKLLIG